MTVLARPAFATNHNEWISYSHWGMFPVQPKTRTASRD